MPKDRFFHRHLIREEPMKFDIDHLERDIAATPALQVSQVSAVACYRAGVHEFLILELIIQIQELTFWMRMERTPRSVRRSAIFWTSQRWPAYDSYSISCDYNALLARGGGKPQLVERLHALSDAPSLYHVASLMGIIREVSPKWELRKTNCCWFCSVTLESLNRHFGGERSTKGYGHLHGFDKVATKRVQERYHPHYLNEAFQAKNEAARRLIRIGSIESSRDVTNMNPCRGLPMEITIPLSSSSGAQDPLLVRQGSSHTSHRTTIFHALPPFRQSLASDPMDISPELTATLFKHAEVNVRAYHLGSEAVGLFRSHGIRQDDELKQRLAPFSDVTRLWVEANVAFAESTAKRAILIRHCARIAHESCKQTNYATALSIVTALFELRIQELPETYRLVCGETMDKIVKTSDQISRLTEDSQAILPLTSSKITAHFDVLKSQRQAVLEREGSIDGPCLEGILRAHQRSGEPLAHNLSGCYSLLLSSMKHAVQNWDWANFSAQMSRLRSEETVEGIMRVDHTVF